MTVATTHLGQLKLLASEEAGVVNASLQFDPVLGYAACMLEAPARHVLPLAAELETTEAAWLEVERMVSFENALMRMSNAIADRFFQQGGAAAPPVKLTGLA